MADLINIRLTKDSPEIEAMDEAAKALGMSRNEMIIKAIGMMISFDKVFYKKLEAYSEKMKVPMWTALQNMTIKRWAQDAAKTAVWGSNPEVLIEFSTTEDGTIAPRELYEMAYQMAFDAEAKERIAALDREVSTGLPLRNEDNAFYEKYKYKYGCVPREHDRNTFAYWENEISESEALEKFKGGKGSGKKQ
ncbi:hypothetical protein HNQ56_000867 [Anaerotaenia torta]|uniref:hypothetical protein n=1 Tax=Anaerotaenia torta TaxID=433293 RepID=UPI003D238266